jgi:hypothetical protein
MAKTVSNKSVRFIDTAKGKAWLANKISTVKKAAARKRHIAAHYASKRAKEAARQRHIQAYYAAKAGATA